MTPRTALQYMRGTFVPGIILSSVVLAEISVGRLRRHDLRRRGPSVQHPRQHLAWVVMFRGEEEVKGDGDDEAGPRKAHRCAVP